MDKQHEIWVFDRRRQAMVREIVLGDRFLKLAYLSPLRGACQWLLFRMSLLTRLLGCFFDSRLSRCRIRPTIEALQIDMGDFEGSPETYRSFNEFFYRRLKPGARPFDAAPGRLVSPADARLTVFPNLEHGLCVPIKGRSFTVAELLRISPAEAARFTGGILMVFRLCPIDYHRYHFPAAGRVLRRWRIDGRLDSVNPVSLQLGLPVFQENTREVALLELEGFGQAAYVEVGAFGVAGMVTTHADECFGKMDEKGYFKFGGSTVVLVFEPGRLAVDEDLLARSREGVETLVRAGEGIGHRA